MGRYARLLQIQLKAAALLAMQYRFDFFLGIAMSLFWTVTALVPLLVLYSLDRTVAGWTWPEMLLVAGFFTALKGVLSGAMQPALLNVVEHVRKGTLDFILLKPADSQFLVSTSKFDLARISDVLGGIALIVIGLAKTGRAPSLLEVATAILLVVCATLTLYSIWILAVSAAFHVVKVDNLAHLIGSTYDAARVPSDAFPGLWSFLFTFVIPLALMTTWPSQALLGRLAPSQIGIALGMATLFLGLSRWAWVGSIGRYTSAGG